MLLRIVGKKHLYTLFLICATLVSITSCGVRKQAGNAEAPLPAPIQTFMAAKSNLSSYKVSGQCTLYTSDGSMQSSIYMYVAPQTGIKLSLRPLPFLDAGAIFFLPNEVIIINKIDKYCVRASYQELSQAFHINVSYPLFESLFTGYYCDEDLQILSVDANNHTLYTEAADKSLRLLYTINPQRARPTHIVVTAPQYTEELDCSYQQYYSDNKGATPQSITFGLRRGNQAYGSLALELDAPKFVPTDNQALQAKIPANYNTLTIESFLSVLGK